MAVSKKTKDNKRLITPQTHGSEFIRFDNTCLSCPDIDITNLVIMRFQLISMIALKRINTNKYIVACIIGGGSVGVAAAIECSRLGIDYFLVSRNKYASNYIKSIKWEELEISKFDFIIDCTGNSGVLNYVISNCAIGTTVLLLGSPPNNTFLDIYSIHEKNIQLIGGHEINGIGWPTRQKEFENLYNWHKDRIGEFSKYVQFHSYSVDALNHILVNDSDIPFHVFKY